MKLSTILKSITESSLSRVWQHVNSDKNFAVISAFHLYSPLEENLAAHQQLKNDVRSLGLGFIDQGSGYTYKHKHTGTESLAEERSLFIPNIKKEDALKLGKKYQQESILFKDESEFVIWYIETGKKDDFNRGSTDTMTFDQNTLKYAYSQFFKSKNKNAIKKFAYVMKEEIIPSREDAYRALKNKEGLPETSWIDVL